VPKKVSRRLVIDTSVARSATLAENPTSVACRRFLEVVLSVCHKVVLSRDIQQEWQNVALLVRSTADEVRIRFLKDWMLAMQRRASFSGRWLSATSLCAPRSIAWASQAMLDKRSRKTFIL
jgi:hypothetical protein